MQPIFFAIHSDQWVYLRAIDGNWVLAVQTAHIDRRRLSVLRIRVDRAVATLRPWVVGGVPLRSRGTP